MDQQIQELLNRVPKIAKRARLNAAEKRHLYVLIAVLPVYKNQEFVTRYDKINKILNELEVNHGGTDRQNEKRH
jgi:hypothetical protein